MKRAFGLALGMIASTLLGCGDDKGSTSEGLDGGNPNDAAQGGSNSNEADAETGADAGKTDEAEGGANDPADGSAGALDYPDERGFEFDGKWFPATDNTTGCSYLTDRLYTRVDGVSEDMKRNGTLYINLPDEEPEGTYTVVTSEDVGTPPSAGEAHFYFNEGADRSDYWWGDGQSGTVSVVKIEKDTYDIVWEDVSIVRGQGSMILTPGTKTSSMNGWYTCAPRK